MNHNVQKFIKRDIAELNNKIQKVLNIINDTNIKDISILMYTPIVLDIKSYLIMKYILENENIDKDRPLEIIYEDIKVNAKYFANIDNNISKELEGWNYNYELI